jgi:molecular chaperone DnaK
LGDKLDAASKSAVEASMEKVRKAAEGDNPAAIKSACDELMQASQALAQHVSADSGGGPEGGGPGEGARSNDDDVIDAEFEKK